MRRVGSRPVWLASMVALLIVLAAPAGAGPSGTRPSETLKAKREALGEMRRQMEEARSRASAARKREVSLLAELEQLDRSLAKKRAEVDRLDQRIGRVEGELRALEGQRGQVAEDTVAQQAALASHLRLLARLTAAPSAPTWIAEAERVTRDGAVEDLSRIARQDLQRLTRFDETAERLQARQEAVGRSRRELADLRQKALAERAAMNVEADRRRALLVSVRDDRSTNERMAAELENAARRLEALIRDLARRAQTQVAVARPREPAGPPPPAVGLGALRGQLPWPAEGRIVSAFGRQVNPRFGTETIRRGIDIAADEGATIRAVYAGVVLYRGWLRGYGNLIVLDHGQGYYTLYAHASDVNVGEGEAVRAGQVIGRVGETGSVDGPRLYFEVRYQGRAQDPQAWLRERP